MHTTKRGVWDVIRMLLVLVLIAAPVAAQVTVPNTLVSGAVIRASDLNTNFSTLGNHALDRLSGGNLSGSITADPGITIDGIDLSTALCSTCAASFQSLTINGVAIIAATGKIPALTSTFFTSLAFDAANLTGTAAAIDGASLFNLTASNIATGTVPSARLGSGSANSGTWLHGDLTWGTGFKTYTEIKTALTPASSVTIDLSLGTHFTLSNTTTITTLTISNPATSGLAGSFTLAVTGNGTSHPITWPASIKWAGGVAPTLTTTNTKVDVISFLTYDGGTTWLGFVGGQNF